jgi:hypothetical protein
MQIANHHSWGDAVRATYPLDSLLVSFDHNSAELFTADNGKSYCTAPYLTDSGDLSLSDIHESQITLSELINRSNCDYILLKLRKKLAEEFEYQLDNDLSNLHVIEDYVSFELDLTSGIDEIWTKSLNQKTRNQVRKAEKNSFDVRTGQLELLDDFYKVISQCWRDLGSPTHSKAFYANIIEQFSGNSLFMVIYDNEKPIATALLLWNDDRIFHPYAGNLRDFNRTSVNNLLYWRIVQLAVERNMKIFDMGRSHKQQGTYRYKSSWGAIPVQLYYHYFLSDSGKMPKPQDHAFYRFATSAWKYLPLSIANFLGPKLIYKML